MTNEKVIMLIEAKIQPQRRAELLDAAHQYLPLVRAEPGVEAFYITARKDVLVLLPDNLGFEGQMDLVQILRKELDVPDQVDLYVEALDLMRLKNSENDKKFADIYRTKYENVKMDVVVAGQRPVLEFLLNHRNDLFPGVPIVFGIVPKDIPAPTQKYPGVTGVVEPLHFERTLDLALELQPDIKKVVLIAGSSPRDKWLGWIAREQIKSYENRVQVEYWEGPTPEEANERLNTQPARGSRMT